MKNLYNEQQSWNALLKESRELKLAELKEAQERMKEEVLRHKREARTIAEAVQAQAFKNVQKLEALVALTDEQHHHLKHDHKGPNKTWVPSCEVTDRWMDAMKDNPEFSDLYMSEHNSYLKKSALKFERSKGLAVTVLKTALSPTQLIVRTKDQEDATWHALDSVVSHMESRIKETKKISDSQRVDYEGQIMLIDTGYAKAKEDMFKAAAAEQVKEFTDACEAMDASWQELKVGLQMALMYKPFSKKDPSPAEDRIGREMVKALCDKYEKEFLKTALQAEVDDGRLTVDDGWWLFLRFSDQLSQASCVQNLPVQLDERGVRLDMLASIVSKEYASKIIETSPALAQTPWVEFTRYMAGLKKVVRKLDTDLNPIATPQYFQTTATLLSILEITVPSASVDQQLDARLLQQGHEPTVVRAIIGAFKPGSMNYIGGNVIPLEAVRKNARGFLGDDFDLINTGIELMVEEGVVLNQKNAYSLNPDPKTVNDESLKAVLATYLAR